MGRNFFHFTIVTFSRYFVVLTFELFAGVRNPKEAKENVESLIDVDAMKGKIYYEQLDTGSVQSVRKFAKIVQSKFSKIDILINNGKPIRSE